MNAKYAVTFEYETKPPLTMRGEISASAMPTLVARATRKAARDAGRQTWSSVSVLIERADDTDDARAR